jgi:hypothetical protein
LYFRFNIPVFLSLTLLFNYRYVWSLPTPWLREGSDHPHLAQVLPHSLIIGWESPGSSFPIGKLKFEKHLERRRMLSPLPVSTMLPFVIPFPNF